MLRNANGASSRHASFNQKPTQLQSCIWPASTRPLFIKSVWRDRWDRQGGYRHFILNTTDWTTTTASTDETQTYKSILNSQQHHRTLPPKQLESLDQREFRSEQNKARFPLPHRQKGEQEQESVTRKEKLRRQLSYQNPTHIQRKLSSKQLPNNSSRDTKDRNHQKSWAVGDIKTGCGARENEKSDKEFYVDPEENYQLTERVLQWLDLAGKTNLPDGSEGDRDSGQRQKIHKRVFTAHPSTSSGYNGNALINSRKPVPPLHRSESVHLLSLTFNEEETTPLPILHLSQLSGKKLRRMSSTKAKTPVPAAGQTYSSHGKFNSMSPKSTSGASSSGTASGSASGAATVTQSSSKPVQKTAKKKSLGKLGKTESIENQYKSMIHRQLLETSCNTQLAKRQLHIFMPNPKLGTAQSNDCDSCLNSLISDSPKN